MRKLALIVLLGIFLVLPGCTNGSEETAGAAEPIEDIYPEMAYGVWETDVLKSEPGNYDRSARVSNGNWAETAQGYYRINKSVMYYADKSNPDNWVPLCSDPECPHMNCSAKVGYSVFFADGRIYYLAHTNSKPDLYHGNKKGIILCSMDMDGTDDRLEFACEEAMLTQSGSVGADLSPTGLIFEKQYTNEKGAWVSQLFYVNEDGARCIYEESTEDVLIDLTSFSYKGLGVRGQGAIHTTCIDCAGDPLSTIHWLEDKSIYSADLSNLPYYAAFFYDGNLRFFRANDGYYDVDLTTMEEVKLCDAQIEDSAALILQANCILESNLFMPNTLNYYDISSSGSLPKLPRVGEGALRLFNGQQWLDVELPEEVKNLPEGKNLAVSTLTGEYIICTAKIDGVQRYYRIDLAAENLKLEYWFETK